MCGVQRGTADPMSAYEGCGSIFDMAIDPDSQSLAFCYHQERQSGPEFRCVPRGLSDRFRLTPSTQRKTGRDRGRDRDRKKWRKNGQKK